MSNKRAELAVKATERLSMENFCLNKKLKTEDNYGKICNAKQATFLLPEASNCMDKSQFSKKQRNGKLSRLDPNNKSRLSKKTFC